MKHHIEDILCIIIFLFGVGTFFYQTLIFGRLPVPGDALVGLYHPWRDVYANTNPQGVPFKNFLTTDPVRQQIPWRKITIDQWKQGMIPKWNPYTFSGTPLAANIQAGVFYPLNILFFIFPFSTAWTMLIILEPLLAGLFLYLYIRHLQLQPIVSLFAAVAWSFSGFAIAWLPWGTIMHVALWLPLILLSIDKLFQNKRSIWVIPLTLSLIFEFLAGHIQISLYVWIIAGCYAIRSLFDTKRLPKNTQWFIAAILIFFFLTSFQWIPFVQMLKESSRFIDPSIWQKEGWFLPWQHLVQFLVPDFFGNPTTLNYWGAWNYGEFIGYIGVMPLFFVLYSLLIKDQAVFFWKTILFLALLFLLPTPLAKIPYQLGLPIISSLQPTRFMVIVDFSLVVLAAFGMNRWLENKDKRMWWSIGFLGLLFLGIWIMVLSRHVFTLETLKNGLSVAQRNLILPSLFFVIGIANLISFSVFGKSKFIRMICILGFVGLTGFDLFRFGWKFIPFISSSYFFPTSKTIEFFTQQKKPFRIMSVDDKAFPPNVLAYYGIESVQGYDPIYLKRYEEFIAASERGKADITPPFGFNRIISPHNVQSPLLPLLNVVYVVSLQELNVQSFKKVFQEGETRVYEYVGSLPRVYFAENILVISEKQKIFDTLFQPAFLPKKTAVVEEQINGSPHSVSTDDQVSIVTYNESSMTIRLRTKQSQFLVISNVFYRDWKALLDKEPAKLYRTNYLFMGLVVPAGEHQLVLKL